MNISHEILSVWGRDEENYNCTRLYISGQFNKWINPKTITKIKYLGDDGGAQGKSQTRPCGGGVSTTSSRGHAPGSSWQVLSRVLLMIRKWALYIHSNTHKQRRDEFQLEWQFEQIQSGQKVQRACHCRLPLSNLLFYFKYESSN